eukprot:6830363-Prymnesium_polylepis.2
MAVATGAVRLTGQSQAVRQRTVWAKGRSAVSIVDGRRAADDLGAAGVEHAEVEREALSAWAREVGGHARCRAHTVQGTHGAGHT